MCEPFRTAGLKLGEGEVVPVYAGQQWAPDMAWDNHEGKVTLAGDAAHSMVPRTLPLLVCRKLRCLEARGHLLGLTCVTERGQGLNNAIKDASDIVDAIKRALAGETSLEAAITAYEAEMKARGATEVALSLEQALKSRNKDTIMDSPVFKLGFGRSKTEAAAGDTVAASVGVEPA